MECSDWMDSLLTALPPVYSRMSHSSEEDGQRGAESNSRRWVEPQPGPSRRQCSRQGYCGYCRVLYSNLDQHLSSLKHLDSVCASSRGSSTVSPSNSKGTLLDRFLHDVLQHHPHRYKDPRPSHADLPSISAPPLPREELDELPSSDDSHSLATREHLPSSEDTSCQLAHQKEDCQHSQSGEEVTEGAIQERLSAPIMKQEEERTAPVGDTYSSHAQTPPPHIQVPPTVHRKAHRKTDRRKTSTSSSHSSPCRRGPNPGLQAPSELSAWLSWQRERREVHKEEAFSSDHTDPLDQTIEEVIQRCCHGFQQEESESFTFSLPISMETQSDDWDSAVQVALKTPVQVSQMEEKDLSHLMDVQVDLKDQVYSSQLDTALHSEWQAGGGGRQDEGFWTLPIEEVLPVPAYIPESFRGKTWAQIEQEDREKVDKLVQQFRRERFICYFDSESLARYGRRSQKKKGRHGKKEVEPDSGVLPLFDCEEDEDYVHVRRRQKKGWAFRVASRCQVVKVSHSTQTVQLVIPAVGQPASEAPVPTTTSAANQSAGARTPDVQKWRCLPPSYTKIITPLQPCTSLVYLLCSPSGPTSTYTPAPGSTARRCRKKKRPLDLQGLKVKYKQLPVRFYDPSSNRVLKNPPKGFQWSRGPASSSMPPPCVRQLFRSLSPALNTDRTLGESASESSRVKGQRSSDTAFTSSFLSTLSRDSAETDKQNTVRRRDRTSQAPPSSPHSRSERGRVRVGREKTHPPPSKRRIRAHVTPLQPRREGLRRAGTSRTDPCSAGPPHSPPPHRGRSRRGQGCKRRQR